MISNTNTLFSAEPVHDKMSIKELTDVVRHNLNSGFALMAVRRIYDILLLDFPATVYQANFTLDELDGALRKGIREDRPVVAAFIENETHTASNTYQSGQAWRLRDGFNSHDFTDMNMSIYKSPSMWKWRIHFVEIAGFATVISDMLSSIKSPNNGTWRSHSSMKEPLALAAFGRGSRAWTCLSKPWEGSDVTLTFYGHTNDSLRRLVTVRTPTQYPGLPVSV